VHLSQVRTAYVSTGTRLVRQHWNPSGERHRDGLRARQKQGLLVNDPASGGEYLQGVFVVAQDVEVDLGEVELNMRLVLVRVGGPGDAVTVSSSV
jgi:hypothetical protein